MQQATTVDCIPGKRVTIPDPLVPISLLHELANIVMINSPRIVISNISITCRQSASFANHHLLLVLPSPTTTVLPLLLPLYYVP